jgi:glycosidase
LFCHKEDGSLALHPTWKSVTTDWAAPAYQQYMADLVLYDLGTYDVDGYRVDAATYKGPNWDPALPYPAYRSGSAAPELKRRMLLAMRSKKPEAVLLSEVFGPVFYAVCNLVHDNQTEAPQFLLEKMEAGQIQAAHYKAHLANVFAALPKGANRVCFARNHDTSWFYHFNGYTARFMALEAVHALCVIPEVFAGDPKNGPHPDADPSTFEYYRKLFALRQDLPELARGELLLNKVRCDNPWVFTALRGQDQNVSLVAVSLSDRETECGLEVRLNDWTPLPNAALKDGISGASVRLLRDVRFPAKMRLTLKPFQAVVGRL